MVALFRLLDLHENTPHNGRSSADQGSDMARISMHMIIHLQIVVGHFIGCPRVGQIYYCLGTVSYFIYTVRFVGIKKFLDEFFIFFSLELLQGLQGAGLSQAGSQPDGFVYCDLLHCQNLLELHRNRQVAYFRQVHCRYKFVDLGRDGNILKPILVLLIRDGVDHLTPNIKARKYQKSQKR